MADLNNPAGRLHALLRDFGSDENPAVVNAWARVLNVEAEDVPLHLGDVGRLLLEVEQAAQETGEESFAEIPRDLRKLSKCIFPVNKAFNDPVKVVRPDPGAMKALGMLSSYLKRFAPDGAVPSDEQIDPVRESVRDLQDEVEDSDLSPEIKRALRHRLADMLEALDHLDIGGPEAIKRAAEALAGTAAIYRVATDDTQPVYKKAWDAAREALELVALPGAIMSTLTLVDAKFGTNFVDAVPPPELQPPAP